MKRIIMFLLLFAALKVAGQTTGYLRFDTVKIMKQNGTCELYVINKTKDSLGLLTNVGGGLTRFIKSKVINDSTIVIGLDTLVIPGAGGTSTILTNIGTGFRLVTTPNGSIKTLVYGYGVNGDSTTNANSITVQADTSETNHLVTQSDLNDAIAGAGGGSSGDITANVFKDSSFVPLILMFGESNAAGDGDNAHATAGEIDADPRVQIMQSAGNFATLNISSNNNFAVSSGRHGWELELSNQIATRFNNRTVYLVKAGVPGSTISQWQLGTANYDTLVNRMNNAIARIHAIGKVPVICGWYSQGINDGVAGTNENTWLVQTQALFNNVRGKYGFFPILMTQLIGDRVTYPKLDAIDDKIFSLALNKDNYIFRIPTPQSPIGGAATDSIITGGIHWSYLGLKAIANRMLNAMMDTAGYINYDRRALYANMNNWHVSGNLGTNPTDYFVGTRDTAQFVIRTNNTEAARFDGSQNFAIGRITARKKLDVASDIYINDGYIGRGAGNIVSNFVFSDAGLPNNSTGLNLTGIGWGSLNSNSTGNFNTAVGTQSSYSNSTGSTRATFGWQAAYSSTGSGIVAIGPQSGSWLTSENNIAVIHNTNTGAWLWGNMSTGQVQINGASTPSLTASAALEVRSTTRGFLMPVMTSSDRTGISSPATGLQVFDTDSSKGYTYNGTLWAANQTSLRGAVTWTPGIVAAGSSATNTITVTGAALGDPVTISKASGAYSNGEVYDAFVSGANTVTIRVHNVSGGSANYNTAETYKVVVLKY